MSNREEIMAALGEAKRHAASLEKTLRRIENLFSANPQFITLTADGMFAQGGVAKTMEEVVIRLSGGDTWDFRSENDDKRGDDLQQT